MTTPDELRELLTPSRYGDAAPDVRLQRLEARAILALREAARLGLSPAMLWSVGKDSSVLLWLTLKAFLGDLPMPLVHIDTGFKPPELIAFRDRMLDVLGRGLVVKAPSGPTFPGGELDRVSCCHRLKTAQLRRLVTERGHDVLVAGIRADEHGTRSKERVFSPRDEANRWGIGSQEFEAWELGLPAVPADGHMRVHPLLEWSELDVWRYIEVERIPIVDLYFSNEGRRFRTLGCMPCSGMVESEAQTVAEVIAELEGTRAAERATRMQDGENGDEFEALRNGGYL